MDPVERIETAAGRSPLVRTALERARSDHEGQVRNGSGGMPYVEHPVRVAALLDEQGYREEVLAAALLHDVVENSETTLDELRELFGGEVAGMVGALTDDESIDSYKARKAEHRERLAAAGEEAMAIYAADKLTNVKMLRDAYREQGEQVGEELSVPLDEKVDVWERDLEMLSANKAESPAVRVLASSLEDQLNALAADRRAADPPA